MSITKNIQFKPMLGVEIPEQDKIEFPVLVSEKLDGIRCIIKDGELYSRSLKPIPNKQIHEKFKHLKEFTKGCNIIFDGELYSPHLTFQEITSQVMTHDKEVSAHLEYWCFDYIENENFNLPCEDRLYRIKFLKELKHFIVLNQYQAPDFTHIQNYFDMLTGTGGEGVIVRSMKGKYKFGRSTQKEQYLMKYKPFVTYDAVITDVIERLENTNESFKNELGESTKRNTKDAKASTGIASAFLVDLDGKGLKVTLTGDEQFRKRCWDMRESAIGQWIEFKGMDVGSKDVPRHPTFLRFREDKNG